MPTNEHSEPDELEQNFRSNLRHYRESNGMTQADLATRLKDAGLAFHQQTIQKMERGERQPRLTEAAAIAHVFGIDLDSLIQDPQVTNLTELSVHVTEAEEALGTAVWEYEGAQSTLAMYADAMGVMPEEESGIVKDLSKTAVQVVEDFVWRQEFKSQSMRDYLSFLNKKRPGTFSPDVIQQLSSTSMDKAGEFREILRAASGKHSEEA